MHPITVLLQLPSVYQIVVPSAIFKCGRLAKFPKHQSEAAKQTRNSRPGTERANRSKAGRQAYEKPEKSILILQKSTQLPLVDNFG